MGACEVIHCDLHPENILMTSEDQFRLVDFGCSRLEVTAINVGHSHPSDEIPRLAAVLDE